ncbi:unnamed protein product [Rotaria magnacalcarata]|uniref:NAD(P)(+)--arginine ADP-ribosyltransferase n=1 Tax=Rotaria magnacalcarata TaxID=392030 RepID=A0A817AHB4_9BILA|nr:unnamed protein product [Rotaria magnacalcarata]CAF4061154.1 unnamed protein product [Rotaria magnacalcarata]
MTTDASVNVTSSTAVHIGTNKQYEDFAILWLDEETNRDDDILFFKHRINYCKVFQCFESCTDLIYKLKDETFFVIISGYTHPFLVNILLEFPQIVRVYLLLCKKDNDEEDDNDNHDMNMKAVFDKHSERLQGPFMETLSMCTKIIEDADSIFNSINRASPLSVFDVSMIENTFGDVKNNKPLFLWFQVLIEILLHMDNRDNAHTDMSFTSRHHYDDNKKVLKAIADFSEDYQPELALHWYTKNSFVYRLINKALRTQDIDIVLKFRFFIKDLHNQLTQLHATYCNTLEQSNVAEFTVYRGQIISIDEFTTLQNNVGNIVATNSFFSTSTNSLVACQFVGDISCRPLCESVLFEIHVQTNIKTKPYAPVNSSGVMSDENEVVFSMGTIFLINSVEPLTDTLWLVDISVVENSDQDLQELFDVYKWDIEKSSSDIFTLGTFLTEIGEYARAIRYYESLSMLPNIDPVIRVGNYYNIVVTYCEQGIYDQAMLYLEKCALAYLLWFPNAEYNYSKNITTRRCDSTKQGHEFTFVKTQDVNTERTLEQHLSYIHDPILASAFFSQLAYIYHKTGKYNEVQRVIENCVRIDREGLDETHIDWHSYSAYDHVCRGEYVAAVNEYKNTLSNYTTRLPSKHPAIGIIHYNMGDLFFLSNQIENAIAHYNLSLNIRQFSLPHQHPLLMETLDRIESICNSTLGINRVKADCLVQLLCFPTPIMITKIASILKDYLPMELVQDENISDQI